MTKKTTEIAKTNSFLATSEDKPEWMKDDARGSEGVEVEDLQIPRLEMIQSLSPQRKKNDPAYIQGAEEGMLFNTVSNELYEGSVFVVPVFFRKEFNIWTKEQTSANGFRGSFHSMDAAIAELEQLETPNLYEVVDTGVHFCLLVDKETNATQEVVISMSKSKMKISRQLNTMVRMAGGDRFSRVYDFSAVGVSGDKGDYYNWKIKQLGFAPKPVYLQAESLYEAVKSGVKDVNRNENEEGAKAEKTVNEEPDFADEM